MKIIEQLKGHPADSKLSLFLRHADRELIPTGEIGNEILINEKGKQNALTLGRLLKEYSVNKIFTSPIPRCIQTADYIIKGYGREVELITTKCLGDPGLHITDEIIAGEFYLKFGFDEMYKRFLNGIEIPGVPDAEKYQELMTNFLKENTKENGLTLFISHDSLIAFYDFCLSKTVYTKENWVDYLSGIILNQD